MRAMKSTLPLALAGPILIGFAGALIQPQPSATSAPVTCVSGDAHDHGSCKPSTAARVTITERTRSDGLSQIDWSIAPISNQLRLRYRIELPSGASLVEGALDGDAAVERGALTEGRLILHVPASDRARSLQFVTDAVFAGVDDDGRDVEVSAQRIDTVWYGDLKPELPRGLVTLADGRQQVINILPSSHP